MTYISLLRGINVGGHKKILMKDLKALYASLGFKDAVTYIQSGNVVFKYKKSDTQSVAAIIEKKILDRYGFDVHVQCYTVDEWQSVINNNSFIKKGVDEKRLYVAFLEKLPSQENIQRLLDFDFGDDQFVIKEKTVYIYYAMQYSNSKLTNPQIESKLKLKATTRNWKTMLQLLAIAEGLP